MMEEAVDNLEKHVKNTDSKLDTLALKVENVEKEMYRDDADIEVFKLLKSVTDVKNDYQNLRKEILEVQVLQKQLTCSLRAQLKLVHGNFNFLKHKITCNNSHDSHQE